MSTRQTSSIFHRDTPDLLGHFGIQSPDFRILHPETGPEKPGFNIFNFNYNIMLLKLNKLI